MINFNYLEFKWITGLIIHVMLKRWTGTSNFFLNLCLRTFLPCECLLTKIRFIFETHLSLLVIYELFRNVEYFNDVREEWPVLLLFARQQLGWQRFNTETGAERVGTKYIFLSRGVSFRVFNWARRRRRFWFTKNQCVSPTAWFLIPSVKTCWNANWYTVRISTRVHRSRPIGTNGTIRTIVTRRFFTFFFFFIFFFPMMN